MLGRRIGNRVLVKNVIWNSVGTAGPLLAALVSIPVLISTLGIARFGILTIIWMVVGYFSLFDLGLGRALTKLVAERIGTFREGEIPSLFVSAMAIMVAVGVLGSLLLSFACRWLVYDGLSIPIELQEETAAAIYVLAFSVPIVVVSTGLRGFLEAHQRFDLVTFVKLPLGILTYVAPVVVSQFTRNLEAIVIALLVVRLLAALVYLATCFGAVPSISSRRPMDRALVRQLLSFGGWMTVSNLVGPLLLYLGRLFVAVMISVEAVAYFATPYEIVTKMLLVPAIIVGVLFPAFSQLQEKDPYHGRYLFNKANQIVAAILIVPLILILLFADWGLTAWINEDFAQNGSAVTRLLALGVFVNSFGHISQALVQGYGRPQWTAQLHLVELILYIPYLWWLTKNYGIVGASIAWVIRVSISTVVLTIMALKSMELTASGAERKKH